VRIPGVAGAFQDVAIFCEGGYCVGSVIYDNDGKEMKKFDPADKGRGPQANFIKAVRSRKIADLKTDIAEGHLSASVCHMGNVSIACGGPMTFEKAKQAAAGNVYAEQAMQRMVEHLNVNGVNTAAVQVTMGPRLAMDSKSQRFSGEDADRANLFVKDGYRAPFIVPEKV